MDAHQPGAEAVEGALQFERRCLALHQVRLEGAGDGLVLLDGERLALLHAGEGTNRRQVGLEPVGRLRPLLQPLHHLEEEMPALVQHGREIGVLEEPDEGPALAEGDAAARSLRCVLRQVDVEAVIRRAYVLIEALGLRGSPATGIDTGPAGVSISGRPGVHVLVEIEKLSALPVLADLHADTQQLAS
ncbi:MAG: hypothetical protein KDE35_14560 [Geminicoccaceae bacterium]|nr:hypothetical protein [Geminicoccaceae bacterium]